MSTAEDGAPGPSGRESVTLVSSMSGSVTTAVPYTVIQQLALEDVNSRSCGRHPTQPFHSKPFHF